MDCSVVLQMLPLVISGASLIIVGTIVTLCRNVPVHAWRTIMNALTVSLEIREQDESYLWVQTWLAKKLPALRSITVYTKQNGEGHIVGSAIDNRPAIYFAPSPGRHMIWFQGRLAIVIKKRNESESNILGALLKSTGTPSTTESITIRIFSRNKELAKRLMEEAREVMLPRDGRIDVRFANDRFGYWMLADRVRPRPIDSLILTENQQYHILDDVQRFQNSFDWYLRLGIPYRRGYLLYGPPGNGKTSMVVTIASTLGMNVYVINLAATGISDAKLTEFLTSVSRNSIILMEDIDCAFIKREGRDKNEQTLTFSGLLNALDGITGKDGRIVFMTTNHIDRLDQALIRPGRIDVRVEVPNATKEQARRMMERFHPDATTEQIDHFSGHVPEGQVNMATIQGYLMKYKDSLPKTLSRASEICPNR